MHEICIIAYFISPMSMQCCRSLPYNQTSSRQSTSRMFWSIEFGHQFQSHHGAACDKKKKKKSCSSTCRNWNHQQNMRSVSLFLQLVRVAYPILKCHECIPVNPECFPLPLLTPWHRARIHLMYQCVVHLLLWVILHLSIPSCDDQCMALSRLCVHHENITHTHVTTLKHIPLL